jgi:hypothetical protein
MGNHIFISYKSQQRKYAYQVCDALREWGLNPWLDVNQLQPGSLWANDIDNALKTCWALVGIMTPQALASRYVTNEWDMAIMKDKLFIPLIFEKTEPHYKYIDIQYIDFTIDNKSKSFEILQKRLTNNTQTSSLTQNDIYHDYLELLYDRINKYLEQKLISSFNIDNRPEPLRLETSNFDNASDMLKEQEQIDPLFILGGVQNLRKDHTPPVFNDFNKAFDYYNGRIILLGEPGSGKTITLLHHARDLVIVRKQNPTAPLPILGIISTWDADQQTSIANWLSKSYGTPPDTLQLIEQGEAVLLLDGLDELGGLRPIDRDKLDSPKFDPRSRFLKLLPTNNKIVITSRTKDFLGINERAYINGIVTLRPLNNDQIRHYLRKHPELLSLLELDTNLKKWLSTPLLLSFLGFAYEGMSVENRKHLISLGTSYELKELIFDEYVVQRYQHEERKYKIQSEQTPYTLEEIFSVLGELAIRTLVVFYSTGIQTDTASLKPMINSMETYYDWKWDKKQSWKAVGVMFPNKVEGLVKFAFKLDLLLYIDNQFLFPHILLRDYFGYKWAINVLQQSKKNGRIASIIALGILNDPRAIQFIQPYVEDKTEMSWGWHESTYASDEAISALRKLKALQNPSE